MRTYAQYCPIVRAVEVLGDRWTLLIVRDMLIGATRFNEISAVCRDSRAPCCPGACGSW